MVASESESLARAVQLALDQKCEIEKLTQQNSILSSRLREWDTAQSKRDREMETQHKKRVAELKSVTERQLAMLTTLADETKRARAELRKALANNEARNRELAEARRVASAAEMNLAFFKAQQRTLWRRLKVLFWSPT